MSQLTLMSLLQQQQSSALTGNHMRWPLPGNPLYLRQPPAWSRPPLWLCDTRERGRGPGLSVWPRDDLPHLGQSRPPHLGHRRLWPRAQPRRGEQPRCGRGPAGRGHQQQLPRLPQHNRCSAGAGMLRYNIGEGIWLTFSKFIESTSLGINVIWFHRSLHKGFSFLGLAYFVEMHLPFRFAYWNILRGICVCLSSLLHDDIHSIQSKFWFGWRD